MIEEYIEEEVTILYIPEPSDSVQEDFAKYLEFIKKNKDPNPAISMRRALMLRLLLEDRDVLNNDMFYVLTEQERLTVDSPMTRNSENRDVMALTLLYRHLKGIEEADVNVILHFLDFKRRVPTFSLTIADWLAKHHLGMDMAYSNLSLRSYVVRCSNLKELDFAEEVDIFALNFCRDKVDKELREASFENNPRLNKRLIRECVTMFLLHTKIEDTLQAKYYLMKAVELIHEGCECELLLRFLENVVLIGE